MKIAFAILFLSTVALASELDGTWTADCSAYENGYLKDVIAVTGDRLEMKSDYFEKADCKTPSLRIEGGGTYTTSDFQNIDVVLGATYITPLSQFMALSLSMISMCGESNWKANQRKDVSGKECDGMNVPTPGSLHYNIFEVQGETTLYMGRITEEMNGESSEARPTELYLDQPFAKTGE